MSFRWTSLLADEQTMRQVLLGDMIPVATVEWPIATITISVALVITKFSAHNWSVYYLNHYSIFNQYYAATIITSFLLSYPFQNSNYIISAIAIAMANNCYRISVVIIIIKVHRPRCPLLFVTEQACRLNCYFAYNSKQCQYSLAITLSTCAESRWKLSEVKLVHTVKSEMARRKN